MTVYSLSAFIVSYCEIASRKESNLDANKAFTLWPLPIEIQISLPKERGLRSDRCVLVKIKNSSEGEDLCIHDASSSLRYY